MSLIVSPSAAVNWTLTRERLCDKALEKYGIIMDGETATANDRTLCLEALDSILKNLLWRGYAWPKTLAAKATLTLTAATPNTTLPADFYNLHALTYLDAAGNEQPIHRIDFPTYQSLPHKTDAAVYPLRGYIDNFNVLWTHPVQTANLTAYLYYQRVILNTVPASGLDLDAPWLLGIPYGIAAQIGDEYGMPERQILRFAAIWEQQLQLGIMNEAPPAPDRIAVDD